MSLQHSSASVPAPSEWFSPKEAARKVQVGARTIYKAVSAGELKASRVNGRDIRIAASWLYQWLEQRAAARKVVG